MLAEGREPYPRAVMDIRALLRSHGVRVTRPRVAVWDALVGAGGHVTVDELVAGLRGTDGGVNRASVYRTLSLFAELDLVRETRLGDDGAGRWEIAHPDEHFHLVCESCGYVDHHVGTLVQQVRSHLDDGHDFEVRTVQLTVSGRCSACRPR